jgi:hypothetical protein
MRIKKKKVTVQIIGGLGNQLFGYFAGRYLAEKIDAELLIDFSLIGVGGPNHGVNIDQLELVGVRKDKNRHVNIFSKLVRRIHFKLIRTHKLYNFATEIFFRQFHSKVGGLDNRFMKLDSPKVVFGYFQTWVYFAEVFKSTSTELQLIRPSDWFILMEEKAKEVKPIMLHVRRGDYLVHLDDFGMLSLDYYRKALDFAHQSFPEREVWVFSDEVQKAKDFLDPLADKNFHWITPPAESNGAESLILMARGSINIIANSTYSWWGAMLNQENPLVVAPSKWFKNQTDPEALIPSHWTKIESSWI